MNFDFDDMQALLVEVAEKAIRPFSSVEYWRERRSHGRLDTARWTQFAELGWLALPVAEDAGGLGGTLEDVALLMIEFGKGLAVDPYVSSAVLSSHLIDRAGGNGRAARLSAMAAGEALVALAHTEAADRYDIAAPRAATARRTERGYLLSGTKMLALDAPSATHLIISATLAGAEETALFYVDAVRAGLSMTEYPLIDGGLAADVRLDGVHVPHDALLAQGAEGIRLLDEAIDRATIALMAQAVGSMEACLELCSSYLKERRQFGQPIGRFQILQHLLVDMLIATHQTRSALYQALAKSDAPPAERNRAVSALKVVAGEAMQLVSRTGIQLHGGYGLTDEYAISHHYRRLLVLEKSFGDIEYHCRRMTSI